MNSIIRAALGSAAVASFALAAATAAAAAPFGTRTAKMFLSDGQNVQVFAIDNQSPGNPLGTIHPTEAKGLAVDRGHLFVARQNLGDVLVYDTSSLRQIGRLTDRGQQPSSVAVGTDGTIYVGNQFSAQGSAGSVSVYAPGSRTPTRTLTCSRLYMMNGVAVNAHGDIFVNQNRSQGYGTGEVDVFQAGSASCRVLPLSINYAGGATVDPMTNDLIVADEGSRQIFIVAPPYRSVTETITLPRCIGEGVVDVALDPANALLYVADPNNGADVLTYPGGTRIATYYTSSGNGIAISR